MEGGNSRAEGGNGIRKKLCAKDNSWLAQSTRKPIVDCRRKVRGQERGLV